jgi:hypothetical protein
MHYLFIVLLMCLNIPGLEQQLFNQEKNQIFGTHLAVNEYMAVFAENVLQRFTVIGNPFSSDSKPESLPYTRVISSMNLVGSFVYIHNIVTGTRPNGLNSVFAMVAEDMNNKFYLIVMLIAFNSRPDYRYILWRELIKLDALENLPLGIDPQSTYVYVVQFTHTLCLDINSNSTINYDNALLWDQEAFIFSQAIVVTEDHHLFLLGFRILESDELSPHLYSVLLSNTSAPMPLSMIELFTEHSNNPLFNQKQHSMVSISLHKESNMIIVGVPFLDTVVVLSVREASQSPVIIRRHISSQTGTFFGKSVAMLDDNTYAVLVPSAPTLPWSSSQVQASILINSKLIRVKRLVAYISELSVI